MFNFLENFGRRRKTYSDIKSSLNVIASDDVPAVTVPPGWLIGPTSRKVDSWSPQLEIHYLPEIFLPGDKLAISTVDGTSWFGDMISTENDAKVSSIVYLDVRSDGNKNIAHALLLFCTIAIRVREILITQKTPKTLQIVLRKKSSKVFVEVFQLLGFQTLLTDAKLSGTFVHYRTQAHNGEIRLGVGDFERTGFAKRLYDKAYPKKIYVARKGSRSVSNNSDVELLLGKLGFIATYFEKIPLVEQLKLVTNASSIVSIHGAALGGTVLGSIERRDRTLVEVFGPYIVTLYREIASLTNMRWCGVIGHIDGSIYDRWKQGANARDFQSRSFSVDLESILLAIDTSSNPNTITSRKIVL